MTSARGAITYNLVVVNEWAEVADTAVKVGAGVMLGGMSAWLLDAARDRRERRRREEDLRRTLLIDPIVKFLDDLMAAIGEVYWASIDGKPPRLEEKMMFFRERQGAVDARITALHDAVLEEKWPALCRKVIEVRIRVDRKDLGEAYDKMKEAFVLGAEVLQRLIPRR
jgi:hypothetical protein